MPENTSKGPSRSECESIIRRILMTEVLEKGTNEHFKTAADFMGYFQSLYPAGPALTKQVQRAVKSMGMPKDERGFYIINKTEDQLKEDRLISFLLKECKSQIVELPEYETLFLSVTGEHKDFLYDMIGKSATFKDKYLTVINSSSGLLFLTDKKQSLSVLLNSLINRVI